MSLSEVIALSTPHIARPDTPERLLAEVNAICARARIASNFFNDVASLPATYQLERIEAVRATPERVRNRRNNFNRKAKFRFIRHVGTHNARELLEMNVPHTQIDRMRDSGFFPKDTLGERLNCSIDHIIALKFGGSNRISNLTLTTSKINAMKDRLENLQWPIEQTSGNVITIKPQMRHGQYMRVPFITGGFRPRNNHV